MAKQVGPVYYEGTIGDIVFYQMNGQYYARFKGNYKSLKQMKRIPKYQRVVRNTRHFGESSSIASWVYQRHLPQELKSRTAWGWFSSLSSRLRYQGKTDKEIKEALLQLCEQLTIEATSLKPETKKPETLTIGTVNFETSELTTRQAHAIATHSRLSIPVSRAVPSPPIPNSQFLHYPPNNHSLIAADHRSWILGR
jgi:hypothetical protein